MLTEKQAGIVERIRHENQKRVLQDWQLRAAFVEGTDAVTEGTDWLADASVFERIWRKGIERSRGESNPHLLLEYLYTRWNSYRAK
jgi:hypothetical protein